MRLSPSPLPTVTEVDFDPEGLSIYRLVLEAEHHATLNATGAKYNKNLVAARTVGFLLHDLWTHQKGSLGIATYMGLLRLLKKCHDAVPGTPADNVTRYEKVYEQGRFIQAYLIRPHCSNTGKGVPTTSQPHSSFEERRAKVAEKIAITPKTSSDAKQTALYRDGYRCMLTGRYDKISCRNFPAVQAQLEAQGGTWVTTECAHIFSASAQDGDPKLDHASKALSILEIFRATDQLQDLYGGHVNRLHNVLTMAVELHKDFDRLGFWLEEVPGQADTYTIHAADEINFFKYTEPTPPRQVTFAVDAAAVAQCEAAGQPIPTLPSRSLLAIRAACSRVAHMSGAGEQYDHILRDLADTSVMAQDGSTADLLALRLSMTSVGA